MKISAKRTRKKFLEEVQLNKLYSKAGPSSFRIVLDGLKPTFNIAKIFRSAQAFGSYGIDLINIAYFNPFPAQGAARYVPMRFFENFESVYEQLTAEGFQLYRLDLCKDSESLYSANFPQKVAFILGHEEHGFSFKPEDFPDVKSLHIPMNGQLESLNVSIAASVAMYEFCRQKQNQPFLNSASSAEF